ncbi:MAG: hypothetical protein LUQ13_00985 [Methanomicrobiales archaeon]|nr:hypothetical protein [Methanomicrobiales archaeon]
MDRFIGKKARTKEEYYRIGYKSARKGNLGDVIGAWRAVTRMDPSDGKAHYCLGLVYFIKDPVALRDAAVREWQTASSLEPNRSQYRTTIALASTNDAEALTEWVVDQWKQMMDRI